MTNRPHNDAAARKRKQREQQRAWLKKNCKGMTAEAVISAAMRGECKIIFLPRPC